MEVVQGMSLNKENKTILAETVHHFDIMIILVLVGSFTGV